MLKQLRTVCALILIASMSLLPMNKEDEFAQAKKFHERLQRAYHGVLQNETESYYKKIEPITANLKKGIDQWVVSTVSIANEEMYENENGFYTHEDISFAIDPMANFDPTQSLNISVMHGEERIDIQFVKLFKIKRLISTSIESYDDVLNAMHNSNDVFGHKLYLIRSLMLQGIVPGENPCVILIEYENWLAQPVTLKGMEIVCRKNEKATNIFFDFADHKGKPVDNFSVIECEHPVTANKNNNINCTFFDSPKTRSKWVPDESNFYDLNNQELIPLPKFYSNSDNDRQKTLEDPLLWGFDDIDISNLLDQVPNEIWELIFLAQNKYATIEPDMHIREKAATLWCAMKRIINCSLVCKRFNTAARKLLPSYTKEIKGYINRLEKKKKVANSFTQITLFKDNTIWSFKEREIRKAIKAHLNASKCAEGETLLTQAIQDQDKRQIGKILRKGTDTKKRNQTGDMPIDLAHANGLFKEAAIIKYYGGDPDNKYEYAYDRDQDKYVCKRGQGGQAYAPNATNGLDAANNNPPPIPPQTFFLSSWISKSHAYLLLAGISASAVAYWLYTKYRTVDEDNIEEDDYLDAEVDSEEDCLNETTTCTVSQ